MLYTTFTVKDKEYKCVLDTKNLVELEKRLNKNPLMIFMEVSENTLPKLGDMLTVFHCSLQKYNHGIAFDDVYDIYDEYIEEGHTFTDFIAFVMDVYKVSGLFKEEKKKKKKGKTEKN